jgi:hypothetical protein
MRPEAAPAALVGHDEDVGLRFARAFVGSRKDFIAVSAVMRQDDLGVAPAARALPIQMNRERLPFGPCNNPGALFPRGEGWPLGPRQIGETARQRPAPFRDGVIEQLKNKAACGKVLLFDGSLVVAL